LANSNLDFDFGDENVEETISVTLNTDFTAIIEHEGEDSA
jgi:hypothetical protein